MTKSFGSFWEKYPLSAWRGQCSCTLVHGPGEFGGLGVTEEAGAAGIGVALFETHAVDVTRHLLRARGIKN